MGKAGGRKPYKFDVKKREQWLESFEKTGSITSACRQVRITRQTIYDTLGSPDAADKEFSAQVDDIKHIQNDMVKNNLFTLSRTHPIAAIFWLCNRDPENWKNVNKAELTVPPGKPLQIEYVPAKPRKKTG